MKRVRKLSSSPTPMMQTMAGTPQTNPLTALLICSIVFSIRLIPFYYYYFYFVSADKKRQSRRQLFYITTKREKMTKNLRKFS